MSTIYELIGRFVVGFARRRYGKEIRTAAAVSVAGVALLAAGAWVATREDDQQN